MSHVALDLLADFRAPERGDAAAIHELIQASPPLDVNSVYAYLLLCEHFSGTCILARDDDESPADGFISGYVPPDRPDVLFIWQVAVAERARGRGLARQMLQELLERPALSEIRFIETTVGPDNVASRKTFQGVSREFGGRVQESALFEPHLFGEHSHDDERLLRIGPLTPR